MLELINDLPSHVVGVLAKGEVTTNDIDTVLHPALDAAIERHGHIHYLLVMEDDAKDWDIGAWFMDAMVGIRHFTKWKKIAVVSNEKGVRDVANNISLLMPGEARGYEMSELDEAVSWVSTEVEI